MSNTVSLGNSLCLTPTEVAEHLRISRAQGYRLVSSGQLPYVVIGKQRRVPFELLREWLLSRTLLDPELEASRRIDRGEDVQFVRGHERVADREGL